MMLTYTSGMWNSLLLSLCLVQVFLVLAKREYSLAGHSEQELHKNVLFVVYACVQVFSCRSVYLWDVVLELRVRTYLEIVGNKLILLMALKVLTKRKRSKLQNRGGL